MAAAVLADRVLAGCARCASAARSRCAIAAAGLPAARLSRAPRQRACMDTVSLMFSCWQMLEEFILQSGDLPIAMYAGQVHAHLRCD